MDRLSDMNTETPDFADMTLDELRVALAPDIAASAIFDGWNETALVTAAEMAGADVDIARLAFPKKPGTGQAMDMIDVIAAYRGNIVAGKQIMKMIGLDLGKNRAPFRNLSAEEYAEVEHRLQGLDFFEYANKVS